MNPEAYEAWYQTPRGMWISNAEFRLMQQVLETEPGQTLLDAGCGTGHFSRRLAGLGLRVTGIDPDAAAIEFAAQQSAGIDYLTGSATSLPFPDASFDHVTAITSLCFIDDPVLAVEEMWRVSRKTLCLGLLNRHSLLFKQKHDSGGYRDARWDRFQDVRLWLNRLQPQPVRTWYRSAVIFPGGNKIARGMELIWPNRLLLGGFLMVMLLKPNHLG